MDSFESLGWNDRSRGSRVHQHSFYDVDFDDDPTDILYRILNNINLDILEHEQNLVTSPSTDEFQYIDPRNNKDCPDEVIDHSNEGNAIKVFDKYPKKSSLSPAQHKITIKYINSYDTGGMNQRDLSAYHRAETKRASERTSFHEFVKEYSMVYFQNIYQVLDQYLSLYRKELAYLAKDILSKEDETFSIICGLPLPQNISAFEADVKDFVVSRREGLTRVFCESLDFQPVAFNKEKYFSVVPENDSDYFEEEGRITLHEDALVFILAACNDIESPSELIFEVKENKTVVFSKPFPSRNFNLRNPRNLVRTILDTYHAIPGKCELITMTMDTLNPQVPYIQEVHSGKSSIEYKVEPFDNFLQPVPNELTEKLSNRVDINFTLKDLPMTIQRNVPFCFNAGNQTLLNFSPKLEYKSCFGGEVMSKYELLSEWVAQKFLPNSLTCRQRLDARTFQKLHSAMLSIKDIEEELEFRYKININHLLGSLHNILEIIYRLPEGKYLLRHSETSHDKFMAYKKTEGVDPQNKGATSLHTIFKEEISNLEFYKKKPFVGIDPKVCSTVHVKSNVAPCVFPFWMSQGPAAFMKDDRPAILKYAKKKEEAREARIKASRKNKKSRKSKERRAKKQEANKEELELQQDIQNDIKLGICS